MLVSSESFQLNWSSLLYVRITSVHKVLTHIEYRAVSGVFRTIEPPTSSPPSEVSTHRTKGGGGGYTLAGR